MGAQSSHQGPSIGQIIGGRYEVVRLIGKGGMGSIYEVRNTRLGHSFAMKTLTRDVATDTKALQRFRREADVIARIKHPHIVEIVDWETLDDGSPAMVMEYLRGEDLAKRIARGPLEWPFIAHVADQMLAALSIAHAGGIVHRDLKPQNVFLAMDDAGDERVKLLDFGVSKVRDSQSIITSDERLVGTPAYMSPEQADGRASEVGAHSDVWAVGVLLYEMATGELPFDAPSVPSLLYRICHGAPASLTDHRPDATPAFVEVVAAALVRETDRRIADAATLRARLRDALRDVAGVRFEDPLPTFSTSVHGRSSAEDDAVVDVSTPAPAKVQTAGTVSLDRPSPTLIARRSQAPFALALAGIAGVAVVIAIAVAVRDKPPVQAAASPSRLTPPLAEVTAPPDAAVRTESGTYLDAAIESGASAPRASRSSAKRPEHASTNHRDAGVPTAEPARPQPPTVEPPAPRKTPCAKEDVECLYGDGT